MRVRWVVGFVVVGAVACGESSEKKSEVASDSPATSPAPGGGSTPGAPGGPSGSSHSGDSTTPPAPPPPPKVVVTNETIAVGDKTRDYVLAVPRDIVPGKKYPLVLVMHGDGGDGVSMRAGMPMDSVTEENAIVAYPSGTDRGWRLYQPPATNPDLAFLSALVGSIVSRFAADSSKVFATGFSSGAFMANQLACREPTLLRGIAAHGGGAPDEPEDPAASFWPSGFVRCANQTTGVAALIVHGELDEVVPIGSATHEAKYWSAVNECASTKSAAQPSLPSPCVQYDGCPAGRAVALCSIPGLGHAPWSSAMTATWQFFRAL